MITFDFETRSYADLTKVGAWAYSEDPTTDIICCSWAIDDGPIQNWWPGCDHHDMASDMPLSLYMALLTGHAIEAHNVAFEISIWTNVMAPKYGWFIPHEHQWRDSMAVACYYALPAGLDALARALHFPGKNPEGKRLISKYSCLYLKTAKTEIPDEDFFKFVEYCDDDVDQERKISNWLGNLPKHELEEFRADLEINMRGLYLDLEGIENASAIVDQRSEELTLEFRELTGLNPGQRDKLILWFKNKGLELENMQAAYLEEILEDAELESGAPRRALEIRLAINKASTKKLDAMARQRGKDGRARFQSRYHGASTGRPTGTGFQPYNLTRGFEGVAPNQLVNDIAHRDAGFLDLLYGNSMEAVGKASRHWIQAEEGNEIIAGDFVSVEAVILACLAGEEWKIEAFRRKEKIYELMADKIYSLAPGTVTKETHPTERQDGKIGELAFGYQGALGAWLNFDKSGRHTDKRIIEICKSWRAEHPAIVAFWAGLQGAAIEAVSTKKLTEFRGIGFEVVDEWLSMIGLDGKRIWYFDAQIRPGMPQWHQPLTKEECAEGTCRCEPVMKLSYMARKTGQWKRVYTYGGKLAENVTQFMARQVLKPAKKRVKEAGYPIILTVYDEIVCEVPKGYGSDEEFMELMAASPGKWADNWPISVDMWRGDRYKK